jgi:AraC family transcriptional regulator of adaptative response/methylated-DNA-[protein]-cysteine methyltransferase
MALSASPGFTDYETYERIAQAILLLRQHSQRQPSLAEVARQVHLSESHLQRLFTQWTGISPKRFLQSLTVEDAKARIGQTTSLPDLSGLVGLSGSGRLHDLLVTLEAFSPGEYKTGGQGVVIRYGIHETGFGPVLIGITDRGICHLSFLTSTETQPVWETLNQTWPEAELQPDASATAVYRQAIFTPLAERPQPLAVIVKGTNFQMQVWRVLLSIPPGGLTTYQTIAAAIGRPTAARAVGNAVGKNPVAYLIPCHRVIRASGALGGYRWGLARKSAILAWEAGLSPVQR